MAKTTAKRGVEKQPRFVPAHEKTTSEKIKEFILLIFVLAFFVGGGGYYLFKFVNKSFGNLDHLNKLNETTLQISQLVDSIRQVYTIHQDEKITSMDRLIEIGAIPASLVVNDRGNRRVINPYGGNIVIEAAAPLINKEENLESPTFKMSYQGLPKTACSSLAIMDWGNNLKGLIAVAIGSVNLQTGEDRALKDIDKKKETEEVIEITDRQGRKRLIKRPSRPRMNVAKPNDEFMATPFSSNIAKMECSCGSANNCSFALHYTVFSVDSQDK